MAADDDEPAEAEQLNEPDDDMARGRQYLQWDERGRDREGEKEKFMVFLSFAWLTMSTYHHNNNNNHQEQQ